MDFHRFPLLSIAPPSHTREGLAHQVRCVSHTFGEGMIRLVVQTAAGPKLVAVVGDGGAVAQALAVHEATTRMA